MGERVEVDLIVRGVGGVYQVEARVEPGGRFGPYRTAIDPTALQRLESKPGEYGRALTAALFASTRLRAVLSAARACATGTAPASAIQLAGTASLGDPAAQPAAPGRAETRRASDRTRRPAYTRQPATALHVTGALHQKGAKLPVSAPPPKNAPAEAAEHGVVRVRLVLATGAEGLHRLHWERMRDPSALRELLCARREIVFSRYLPNLGETTPPRPRRQLRALAAFAQPERLEQQGFSIFDVLAAKRDFVKAVGPMMRVDWLPADQWERCTFARLVSRIPGNELLYLVCHGRTQFGEDWLYLETEHGKPERVRVEKLAHRLHGERLPRLAILALREKLEDAGGPVLAALGQRLVAAGIPAVIAIPGGLDSAATNKFIAVLAERLNTTGTIDLAMADARRAMASLRPGAGAPIDLALPVLFTSLRTGQLWQELKVEDGFMPIEEPEQILRWVMKIASQQAMTGPLIMRQPGQSERRTVEKLHPEAGRTEDPALEMIARGGVTRPLSLDPSANPPAGEDMESEDGVHPTDGIHPADDIHPENGVNPEDGIAPADGVHPADQTAPAAQTAQDGRWHTAPLTRRQDNPPVRVVPPAVEVPSAEPAPAEFQDADVQVAASRHDAARLDATRPEVMRWTADDQRRQTASLPAQAENTQITRPADEADPPAAEPLPTPVPDKPAVLPDLSTPVKSHTVEPPVPLAPAETPVDKTTARLARSLGRLRVFAGAFDRQAGEWVISAVGGPPIAGRVLEELLARGWVVQAGARYRVAAAAADMPEAALSPSEHNTALLAHAGFYLSVLRLSEQLYRRDKREDDLNEGVALFTREWREIEAAQAWLAAGESGETARLELCTLYPGGARHVLRARLDARVQAAWLESALRAARLLGDTKMEGSHLGNLGNLFYRQGEGRKAMPYWEKALVILHALGDQQEEEAILSNMGLACMDIGDARRAIEYYARALIINRQTGDRRGEGITQGNLGNACAELGDVRGAIDCYEQALKILREVGDRRGEGAMLGNLGLAYASHGDTRLVIDCYEKALIIDREVNDRHGESADLNNLGNAYADLGEPRRAAEYYEQSLAIDRQLNDRRRESKALSNLGLAYNELGEHQRAIQCFEQAIAIDRQLGDRRREAKASWNIGLVYEELGDIDRAIQFMQVLVTYEREIGHPDAEKDAAYMRGIVD